MGTQRRGLGPVLSPEDYKQARRELNSLVDGNLSSDDQDYFDRLTAIVEVYHLYSFGEARALPQKMLEYCFEVVKPIRLEELEATTGISDLQRFMVCNRELTDDERQKLADYFGISADLFVGT